jgi:predicted RNase H-like nuclease
MNERIKQLAEQAGFYYTDKTGFITPAGCDPAKFAQLIVRECMDICKKHPSRDLHNGWFVDAVAPHLVQQIEEHFGVEE